MRIIAFAGIGLLLWAAVFGLAMGVGNYFSQDYPGEDFSSIGNLVIPWWVRIVGLVVFVLSVLVGVIAEIAVWREKAAGKADPTLRPEELKMSGS